MKIFRSYSSKETKKLGERLARHVTRSTKHDKNALVFALEGELGSGKTTFIQGFLRGLGIRKRSPSPTFIIFRRFNVRGQISGVRCVYHIDAYRIKNPRELLALGFREIVSNPKNLVIIEWADKIRRILPRGVIRMKFSHGKKESERSVVIKE